MPKARVSRAAPSVTSTSVPSASRPIDFDVITRRSPASSTGRLPITSVVGAAASSSAARSSSWVPSLSRMSGVALVHPHPIAAADIRAAVDRLALAVGALDRGAPVDLEARLALLGAVVGAGRGRHQQRDQRQHTASGASSRGSLRRPGSGGEHDREPRALPGHRLAGELAAVGPRDAVHQGQPEAEAAEAAGGGRVALAEVVEDRLQAVGRDAQRRGR